MKQISFESILSLDPASLPVSMSTGQELGPIGLGTVSVFNPVPADQITPHPTKQNPWPKLGTRPSLMFLLGDTKLNLQDMTMTDLMEIKETVRLINLSMSPATDVEIAILFRKMCLIYPDVARTEESIEAILECWIEDLSKYPIDLIQEGCRLWRTSKERFLPTTGNILPLISDLLWSREVYCRSANGQLKHIEWRLAHGK